jgi:hypothetical protein
MTLTGVLGARKHGRRLAAAGRRHPRPRNSTYRFWLGNGSSVLVADGRKLGFVSYRWERWIMVTMENPHLFGYDRDRRNCVSLLRPTRRHDQRLGANSEHGGGVCHEMKLSPSRKRI